MSDVSFILEAFNNTDKLTKVKELNSKLSKWKYGVLINGKLITDPDKVDWSQYRMHSLSDMNKYHAGICWDFVNYQHDAFTKMRVKDKSYMFVMQKSDNPDDIVTHTFSIITIDGKQYWFESSWRKHQGLHEVDSYKDVVEVLKDSYGKDNPYDVYAYNPSGTIGMSNGKFFQHTTSTAPIFTTTKK